MVRKVVSGVWLLATLALAAACCRASHGGTDFECADLACQCTDSGFSYTGECVDGAKLCQCPAAQPHQLACATPSCTPMGGGPTRYGKLYKPVSW